jgi:hypothetical protein
MGYQSELYQTSTPGPSAVSTGTGGLAQSAFVQPKCVRFLSVSLSTRIVL